MAHLSLSRTFHIAHTTEVPEMAQVKHLISKREIYIWECQSNSSKVSAANSKRVLKRLTFGQKCFTIRKLERGLSNKEASESKDPKKIIAIVMLLIY